MSALDQIQDESEAERDGRLRQRVLGAFQTPVVAVCFIEQDFPRVEFRTKAQSTDCALELHWVRLATGPAALAAVVRELRDGDVAITFVSSGTTFEALFESTPEHGALKVVPHPTLHPLEAVTLIAQDLDLRALSLAADQTPGFGDSYVRDRWLKRGVDAALAHKPGIHFTPTQAGREATRVSKGPTAHD